MTPPPAGMIEFRGVDVVFGKRPGAALRLLDQGLDRAGIQERTGQVVGVAGATLSVREGEVCVLMGLSGSGKSTLLRCVNGLSRATRGEVLVSTPEGPVDAAGCDARSLRRLRTRTTAMVFQQFALLPWRTVAENVGFGLELQGVSRRERARVVEEKLAMVGLERWRDARTHQLSGGMQQRVGLARAFALDAPVLLMDEPFSALDPLIRARLQDELLDLQHRLRKTIVFVSHDLDEAMKIGNRIAIMEEGRIVQHGTPEEIALSPANGYVADFVAHMNPVNVLRGASIMTPVEALARRDGALLAEADTGTTLTLDARGAVVAAHAEGYGAVPVVARANAPVAATPVADTLIAAPPGRSVVTAPPGLTLREALEIRRCSGAPVVLAENGRAIGVIGNRELYEAVLGRSARPPRSAGAVDRAH